MLGMALLVLCVVAPVMAKPIGPQKAVKNPNIIITPEGVELLLPSGGANEWMANTELSALDFIHMLDASKAKIPNAMLLTLSDLTGLITNPAVALEAENKWGYISHDVLVELLILEGLTREQAEAMASMWPEGLYIRFVNIGKNWDS